MRGISRAIIYCMRKVAGDKAFSLPCYSIQFSHRPFRPSCCEVNLNWAMVSSRRRIRSKAWLMIHKTVSFGAAIDKSAYTGSHGFRVR